jgi:hypothetical protein
MAFASPRTSEAGIALVAPTEADYGGSSFWFGSSFTAVAGVSTPHDVHIDQTCKLFSGSFQLFSGSFHVAGSTQGDTIEFEVVDVDGVLAPAGTVLTQYVDSMFVVDDERRTLASGQAANIVAGLYLRVVYHSTGQQNVTINLDWQVFR